MYVAVTRYYTSIYLAGITRILKQEIMYNINKFQYSVEPSSTLFTWIR